MNCFVKVSNFVPPSKCDPKPTYLVKDLLWRKKTSHTLGAFDLLKKLTSAKVIGD